MCSCSGDLFINHDSIYYGMLIIAPDRAEITKRSIDQYSVMSNSVMMKLRREQNLMTICGNCRICPHLSYPSIGQTWSLAFPLASVPRHRTTPVPGADMSWSSRSRMRYRGTVYTGITLGSSHSESVEALKLLFDSTDPATFERFTCFSTIRILNSDIVMNVDNSTRTEISRQSVNLAGRR